MKKMLSLVLALVLLLGCLPMNVLADTVCSYCGGTGHDATDDHCTTCGAYGHASTAPHCTSCHWLLATGHATDCATLKCSCGQPIHDGNCCTTCGGSGHTASASHCASCKWVAGAGHATDCATLFCDKCGETKHEGYCCNLCYNYGHTSAESHCSTCHWVDAAGHAPDCATLFCDKCGAAEHEGLCCNVCYSDGHTPSAPHCVECHWLLSVGHATGCKQTIVCASCGKVGGGHEATCLVPCTADAACTSAAHKAACPAPCTLSASCTSQTHKPGCTSLLRCTYCGKKGHELNNCPDIYYACGCPKTGHLSTCTAAKWSVTFNPNYGNYASTVIDNVLNGTKVSEIYTPSRVGYSFAGWYWDAQCTEKVRADEVVNQRGLVFYAKWTQTVPHEVYVKVYTNGNTKTVAKYVDLYGYAQDGVITLNDVKSAIKEYIKPNTTAGLSVYGPFNATQWESYCIDDYYRNPQEKIYVNSNEKTVIYAMVHNAKIGGSSASSNGAVADSSNPKTGDMIFAPVAVMGLSISALAVLFYLNKKRAY